MTLTCDLNSGEAEAQGFNFRLQLRSKGTSHQSIKKNRDKRAGASPSWRSQRSGQHYCEWEVWFACPSSQEQDPFSNSVCLRSSEGRSLCWEPAATLGEQSSIITTWSASSWRSEAGAWRLVFSSVSFLCNVPSTQQGNKQNLTEDVEVTLVSFPFSQLKLPGVHGPLASQDSVCMTLVHVSLLVWTLEVKD